DWLANSALVPQAERETYAKPAFLAKVDPVDPVHSLPKLQTQKLRIQIVKDEAANPVACHEKTEKAAPANAVLFMFDDSISLLPSAGGGKLFDWIKLQLHNPQDQTRSLAVKDDSQKSDAPIKR